MKKILYILAAVAVILIVYCRITWQNRHVESGQFFVSGSIGFSVHLPEGYSVDESSTSVRFIVPTALATSTNLSQDSAFIVERVPTEDSTSTCSASVASTSEAAAGNRYEETIYTLAGASPCLVIHYFIHYGVFENYPPGTIREFDKQAIISQFDAIRRSLSATR